MSAVIGSPAAPPARGLLPTLFVGVFMAALDTAVIAPVIPALRAEFGLDHRAAGTSPAATGAAGAAASVLGAAFCSAAGGDSIDGRPWCFCQLSHKNTSDMPKMTNRMVRWISMDDFRSAGRIGARRRFGWLIRSGIGTSRARP